MNENGIPLAQNQYVQELFETLYESGRDASGLVALLGHVSDMESFVKRAEEALSDMKAQLADMKEVQNHPVKTALQNAITSLEKKVAEVKVQLSELKNSIVEGCKTAVAVFKEKGAAVLDKLAVFFHIKDSTQAWQRSIDGIIKTDDKALAKIEAFAVQYHSAGLAVKNMARVAVGREPLDAKKETGKLVKALAAPYKTQKNAVTGLRNSLDKVIASLDALDAKTAEKQAERVMEKKPSLLARLEANKARVKEQQEREVPERTKVQRLEV